MSSRLCTYRDFGTPWFRDRLADIREGFLLHRKPWEFAAIAQALLEGGMLREGRTGVGFAVGGEPLPSLFASRGATILATDQEPDAEALRLWGDGQLCGDPASLNRRGICPEADFARRCTFRRADMRALPEDLGPYDFCWSSCAFEHLGSLEAGLAFVVDSCRRLRPGGLAAHTTEFNCDSDGATTEAGDAVIYRRRDIAALAARLAEVGCTLDPVDWSRGDHPIDYCVDESPDFRGPFHLKLRLGPYVATSLLLVIRKAGRDRQEATPGPPVPPPGIGSRNSGAT